MDQSEFDRVLEEIMDEKPASVLLSIPGVYEAVSEHFNNGVLARMRQEAAKAREPWVSGGARRLRCRQKKQKGEAMSTGRHKCFVCNNPGAPSGASMCAGCRASHSRHKEDTPMSWMQWAGKRARQAEIKRQRERTDVVIVDKREYDELVGRHAVAVDFAPTIYLANCDHYVAEGFVCMTCGNNNPRRKGEDNE